MLIQESRTEARKVEQTLFQSLEKIYRRIRRDPDFPNFTANIYQKYYFIVQATIRKNIEEVHRQGIEYVGSKLKQEIFMTSTDLEIIKVETEFTTKLFFDSVSRESEILQREFSDARLKGASFIEDTLSGMLAVLKRIVISAVTVAFSKAILSKANQLPPVEGLSFTQTNTNSHKVRWVTAADERVCPICMRLHNQIFYTDNVNVPLPGTMGSLGSHFNCRCYYVLVN